MFSLGRGRIRTKGSATNMRQAIHHIEVTTDRIGLVDITAEVAKAVTVSGIGTGLATLFCRHTSASLVIQENADPDVPADIEAWFAQAVPEAPNRYRHDESAGPDDPPSHIRTALTATSVGLPIESGRLALGTWQAVFLFEHRRDGRRRDIVVHVSGE
jgi:secondary thiamine-phosphate synthase enzyme